MYENKKRILIKNIINPKAIILGLIIFLANRQIYFESISFKYLGWKYFTYKVFCCWMFAYWSCVPLLFTWFLAFVVKKPLLQKFALLVSIILVFIGLNNFLELFSWWLDGSLLQLGSGAKIDFLALISHLYIASFLLFSWLNTSIKTIFLDKFQYGSFRK